MKIFFFRDTLNNALSEKDGKERRKHARSKCVLPAEIIKSEGNDTLAERATVHNISREGLKLIINFMNIQPGSDLELKIFLPEKQISTLLSGEVTWHKFIDDKLEVGLKIKEIDETFRNEILKWVFPKWIKIEEEEEEKK